MNLLPFMIMAFIAGVAYLIGGWHAAGVAALVWLGILIVVEIFF